MRDTEFAIELGRWLVGECGVYLTRIVDRKLSHGKTFLVTDGGMQHQLAASGNFGQVVRRNYPVAIASRFGAAPEEEVSIVGCLCTPLDRLADDVMMPRAEVGDLVAVFLAGAYGLSASPQAFLAQQPALEMVVERRRLTPRGAPVPIWDAPQKPLVPNGNFTSSPHSRARTCASSRSGTGGAGSGSE